MLISGPQACYKGKCEDCWGDSLGKEPGSKYLKKKAWKKTRFLHFEELLQPLFLGKDVSFMLWDPKKRALIMAPLAWQGFMKSWECWRHQLSSAGKFVFIHAFVGQTHHLQGFGFTTELSWPGRPPQRAPTNPGKAFARILARDQCKNFWRNSSGWIRPWWGLIPG